MKFINIGYGNVVSASQVIAVVSPDSAPIKRMISESRDRNQLIDATYGRRTRAVMMTASGYVILSAIQPETLAHRFVVQVENSHKNNSNKNIGRNTSTGVSSRSRLNRAKNQEL